LTGKKEEYIFICLSGIHKKRSLLKDFFLFYCVLPTDRLDCHKKKGRKTFISARSAQQSSSFFLSQVKETNQNVSQQVGSAIEKVTGKHSKQMRNFSIYVF